MSFIRGVVVEADDDSQAGDYSLQCQVTLHDYPSVKQDLLFAMTLFAL